MMIDDARTILTGYGEKEKRLLWVERMVMVITRGFGYNRRKKRDGEGGDRGNGTSV